jgi:hypothetical protein
VLLRQSGPWLALAHKSADSDILWSFTSKRYRGQEDGHFVLRHVAQTWKMPRREWCKVETLLAIMFDDRFVKA